MSNHIWPRLLPWFAFVMALAVLASRTAIAESAEKTRPHIVIILVDDMGYGDTSCYNPHSKIKTPHIDRLASEGMRFTDAHAAGPLCHMSRYGLLTGCYPFRTNVGRWPTQPLIEAGQTTIASLCQQRGYRTAMVGKWHLGFAERGYDKPLPGGPVDVGFDSFFGIRASTDIPPYFYIRGDRAVQPPTEPIGENHSEGWSPIQGAFWREGLIAPDMKLEEVLPRFTEEAISVIQQHVESDQGDGTSAAATEPLMLYVAFPAPHTPWLPSEEFVGTSEASMYGDFMQMVDAMVGRILDTLDDQGMSDETLVFFSSDNGPTWYDKDRERFQHDSAGGWRGMKADAWEAGHRVPFIARWPGRIVPASTSDQTICFTDMLDTLAAITGEPFAESQFGDSFNFAAALLAQSGERPPVARPYLPIRSGSGLMTIRQDGWKLIDGLGSGGFTKPSRIPPQPGGPAGQLYHLAEDPSESRNLYQTRPDKVAELRKLMDAVVNRP